MPQVRAHGGRQRKVLGRGAVVSGSGQGEAKAELRVIIARAGVDDPAEAAGRLGVVPGVELGAAERLQDAPRVGLSGRRALEQLGCRRGTAAAQQVQTTAVKGVYVLLPVPRLIGRARLFAGTGILTA
jgi:hypothetical protein